MTKRQKKGNSVLLHLKSRKKTWESSFGDAVAAGTKMEWGLEREGLPSL